jgi:hypothetical protein
MQLIEKNEGNALGHWHEQKINVTQSTKNEQNLTNRIVFVILHNKQPIVYKNNQHS